MYPPILIIYMLHSFTPEDLAQEITSKLSLGVLPSSKMENMALNQRILTKNSSLMSQNKTTQKVGGLAFAKQDPLKQPSLK